MTKDKAKTLLDNLIGMVEDNQASEYDEALRMAITELEQQPCDDMTIAYLMGVEHAKDMMKQEPCDTISREAVLNLLDKDRHEYTIQKVKALPSVQLKPIECDDAISLDDAKEIIARNDSTNGSIAVFTGKQVQQMLDSLPRIIPSFQPSRKGHWIDALYSRKCSECGYDMCKKDEWGQFIPDKACPNCGADMFEPQESEEQTDETDN